MLFVGMYYYCIGGDDLFVYYLWLREMVEVFPTCMNCYIFMYLLFSRDDVFLFDILQPPEISTLGHYDLWDGVIAHY